MKTRKSTKTGREGWTLLECMIVVAIIGVAALIGVPAWQAARNRSQVEVCTRNQTLINEQLNILCLDRNWPCTVNTFPDLMTVKEFLCPLGGSAKYIKRRTVFACPANPDQTIQLDYDFVRSGIHIDSFDCIYDLSHN